MTKTRVPLVKEDSSLPERPSNSSYLLTIDEVATRLRIGRSTAYRLCHEGELPALTIGKAVRVPAEALEEWLRRNIRKA